MGFFGKLFEKKECAICGGGISGLRTAVDYFLDEFVEAGSDVVIPADFERIVYHQFDIPALYVNMNLVDRSWKIVISDENNPSLKKAAQQLQTAISGKCGFELAIVAGDESTPRAFILSDSKPEVSGVHSMHVEDNRLIIRSSASTGIAGCVQLFIDMYFSYGARGKYNFPGDFEYLDLGDYMIVTYPDAG